MTLRLRWASSWASFRLRRSQKLQLKETRRLILLERMVDQSSLRLKELSQVEEASRLRLTELEESRRYREGTLELEASPLPPELQP